MIKSTLRVCTPLILIFMLSACSFGDPELAWQKIKVEALLVDVRTPEEYEQGHVPGARLIPYDQVEARLSEFGPDKSRPIVLYCKRGVRADRAQEVLTKHGYVDVTNGGGYSGMMAAMP